MFEAGEGGANFGHDVYACLFVCLPVCVCVLLDVCLPVCVSVQSSRPCVCLLHHVEVLGKDRDGSEGFLFSVS